MCVLNVKVSNILRKAGIKHIDLSCSKYKFSSSWLPCFCLSCVLLLLQYFIGSHACMAKHVLPQMVQDADDKMALRRLAGFESFPFGTEILVSRQLLYLTTGIGS